MHTPKPVNWAAAQAALAAERSSIEIMAALLGVETWEDARREIGQQRDPDITIHARHCGAFVFRGPHATDAQAYESLRDVAERSLPDDPPMHEINGRLRRELDTVEADRRELRATLEQAANLLRLWQESAPATGVDALHDLRNVLDRERKPKGQR